MAEKRMYSKKITDSDDFIQMPASSQALYFHLNQGADDDGFNNQIQIAMLKAHASIDDLKVLMTKNFIMRFESGVVVVKHWWIHNTLRKDRYTPTNFQEELKLLGIKDNKSYTFDNKQCSRLPSGCQVVATDKNREDKISLVKNKEIINNNINNYGEATKDEKGEKIFKRMLYEISEDILPLTYETFFKNLKFGGIADDCIVIETVSLYRDYIEKNHKEILIDALKVASEDTLKGVIWEI